jgi:hypothetical protein
LGEVVRFLTLTSSKESPSDIHRSFEIFVKRVRRKFGRFEYIAVKELTKSGLAHIHVLFRGCYMDFEWVRDTWYEIHRAKVVYLEQVRGTHRQVSAYLVKYLDKEYEGSYRFWCSFGWVFRGFVGFWYRVVRKYRDRAVVMWGLFLTGRVKLFDRWFEGARLVVLTQKTLDTGVSIPFGPALRFGPLVWVEPL